MKTIIPVLVVITAALISATAMWMETLEVNGIIKTGSYDPAIIATKLITTHHGCNCCNNNNNLYIDPQNPLTLYAHIKKHAAHKPIWIGIMLTNKGTIPYRVKSIKINTTNSTIYVYGPYTTQTPPPLWSNASPETLPYPGTASTPSKPLDQSSILIIWVKLTPPTRHGHCNKTITYEINIETTPFNT